MFSDRRKVLHLYTTVSCTTCIVTLVSVSLIFSEKLVSSEFLKAIDEYKLQLNRLTMFETNFKMDGKAAASIWTQYGLINHRF